MKKIRKICIYSIICFICFITLSCKDDSKTTESVTIGQSYQGGVVAYILRPGDKGYDAGVQHGLIAASSDQGESIEWGCYVELPGANGTAIGTGNQNTIDIMTGCTEAGIAARLCGDLVLAGYSDWYLPSIEELARLYDNKALIGGFKNEFYWSSSQKFKEGWNGSDAWGIWFDDGKQEAGYYKDYSPNVRAIRSF